MIIDSPLPTEPYSRSESRIHQLLTSAMSQGMQCPICYTKSDYLLTIFYDGSVDKCGNIAPSKTKGQLLENGEIEWSNSLEETYGSIWKGHTVCTECKYLPLCMGLCPVRRRRFIEKNEPLKCFTEKPDKHFETLILDYVNSFKK